ncbi:sensor histidine kinase [Reichenbachiella sp.]|uniref:sensor histidine kinase n=1 Tax=Reichenbachiella sp. TaxID=2184521 RepID=UPI003B5934C5
MRDDKLEAQNLGQFTVISAVVWVLVFALTVSESLFYYQLHNEPAPYKRIIVNDLFILFWVPLSPVLFVAICHLFARKKGWLSFAVQLFGLCMLAIALILGVESMIHFLNDANVEENGTYGSVFVQLITFRLQSNLVLGLGFMASCVAYLSYSESQTLSRKQTELNQSLMAAQLGVLKAQIKPHFLFNSLHAISGLVLKKENDLAITVIAKLSDLLRESIEMDSQKWITVKEEIDFIKRYLDIYILRFGEDLKCEFELEGQVENLLIPPALLQPIVENALVHGVVPNDNRGTITICIQKEEESVQISVQDTGCLDNKPESGAKEGLGLSNTRKRLSSLFQDDFSLGFDNNLSMTKIVYPAFTTEP